MDESRATLKNLWEAVKSKNTLKECLIYMELFWGLHPHHQRFWSYVKYSVILFSLAFVFVLCLLVPIYQWKGVETLGESDLLSPMYQVIFTLLAYRINQKTLSSLINKLDLFWALESYDKNVQKRINRINHLVEALFSVYRTIVVFTIFLYSIMPYFSSKRTLIVVWYDLCDLCETPCYVWSMSMQTFIMLLVFLLLTCDGLYMSFILRVYCQLKMVKQNFRNLRINEDTTGDEEETMRELAAYVEHHARLIDSSYISDMKKFYSPILLSQFASLTYTLCIGSFLLTIDGIPPPAPRLIKFLLYLSCVIGQLAVYCVGGQVLLDECYSVARTVYETKWWCKTQPRLRKSLVLIILRSQKEICLTVGNITALDLGVYVYVGKTAFSFYTLMNQLYEKKREINNA